MKKRILYNLFFFCITFLVEQNVFAQHLTLQGTVYDYFSKRSLNAVTVQSSSGSNAITDSSGSFTIPVLRNDSVWFSYFSKKTSKYPVDTISNLSNFEIALYVDANWLPEVRVKNRNYKLDSLENRQEYSKVFNFKKTSLKFSSPSNYVPGAVTVGLDLDELINLFRFKRNRQIESMQQRLIFEEQERYINNRFTKYLIQKLTPLRADSLDSFMKLCRPSYDLLIQMNELELGYYIKEIYKLYQKKNLSIKSPFLQKDND